MQSEETKNICKELYSKYMPAIIAIANVGKLYFRKTENESTDIDLTDIAALNSLSAELKRLTVMLDEFNPFKVVGVSDSENHHSNMLAWLMNPNEDHRLGDSVFRDFLLKVLREAHESADKESRGNLPEITDVNCANFTDLKVRREQGRTDILCVSKSNDIVVVIENKIKAEEGKGQLPRYINMVKEEYSDIKKPVFVYLTLGGEKAIEGEGQYISFKHDQVYEIIKSTVEVRKEHMSCEVYAFIKHYLRIMEVNALIGELYHKYDSTVEIIKMHGKPERPPERMMQKFHEETNTNGYHSKKSQREYRFVPKTWCNKVPETNIEQKDKYLVFFHLEFKYEEQRVILRLYVGESTDRSERNRLACKLSDAISAAGMDIPENFKVDKENKSSTAVYLKNVYVDDIDLRNHNEVIERLIKVYNNPPVQQVLGVIDRVVHEIW
jgi:hypothetical protein